MAKARSSRLGKYLMFSGLVISLLPVALWGVFSLGCENPFSEGSCPGASYLWFLIASLPMGALVSLLGLALWLFARWSKAS